MRSQSNKVSQHVMSASTVNEYSARRLRVQVKSARHKMGKGNDASANKHYADSRGMYVVARQ